MNVQANQSPPVMHPAALDDDTVHPKPEAPDMQVQVTAVRYTMMGAEGAIMGAVAQTYDPLETVESLVLRLLRLREPYLRHDPMDHVILRVVEGTEPECPGHAARVAQESF